MNDKTRKLLVQIIVIQVVVSLLHMLVFNISHPLINFLSPLSLWIIIPITCVYGILIYVVLGYLLVIAKQDKVRLWESLKGALIALTVLLLLLFVITYIFSFFYDKRTLWIIYSALNSISGSLMYLLPGDRVSFFWILTAFLPAIGLYLGVNLRLTQEKVI